MSRSRRTGAILALALTTTAAAPASAPPAEPPAGQAAEAHAAGERPAVLLPGLSAHHHPIRTASDEAQKFFDQGLDLAFAFNHEQAALAFERAAALDPKAPMPLWGLALVLGPNINMPRDPDHDRRALEAARKARTLLAGAAGVETDYVEALAHRYSDDPKADGAALDRAYADAMGDLRKRYPDDLDAATLYAESLMDLRPWKLWTLDGKPAPETEEILSVLESVLRRDPDHIGANHYYIHATEASPNPERALASAKRLETLAPGAGHLVHMPGHVYLRTGDYDAAANLNDRAVEADLALFKIAGKTGMYPLMYYAHNLHFVMTGRMQEGRYEEAMTAAREMQKEIAPYLAADPIPAAMQSFLELYASAVLSVDLRFGKWAEILALPAPDPRLRVLTAVWHATRGVAFAARRDFAGAASERKAFGEAGALVRPDSGYGYNMSHDILNIAGFMLDGRFAEARGDRDAAILAWGSAVQAQDALVYDDPPDWFFPVRESHGGALLRSGRVQEAERVFRADLERNPRNPRSLFGLWRCLVAQRRDADAGWVKRQFDEAWRHAATPLKVDDL